MKKLILLLLIAFTSVLITSAILKAQDDDCCPEEDRYGREDELLPAEWEKMMSDLEARKLELQNQLSNYDKDINSLKSQSSDLDKKLTDAEDQLYSSVGSDRKGVADFRKKFDETEKKINNKLGTADDARKSYFNEIEASRIKCLPEFYSRYLAMKTKLESWGKESGKSGQYTVVKGDCLWKIAGKKEIYSNNNYWPKLWEANQDGVISALKSTPKKITNPNLIYPGQVLKVPGLSEDDVKKLNSLSYVMKVQKQADDFKKEKKKDKKDKDRKKKDIKKDKSKDDKKKDIKKDDKKKDEKKKDVKKDDKKKDDKKKSDIKK